MTAHGRNHWQMAADLSIIIVSWNCRDDLAACLGSLAADRHGPTFETIVVDNASRDGSAEMVRGEFPGVTLIANAENRGFAAANNQGAAVARGRHLLFLNPDTLVPARTLDVLVRTLDEDDGLGACGPQLIGTDGGVQTSVRTFPTFAALLHQYTPLRILGVFRGAYRRYKSRDFDFQSAADVDSLMGAALCVPRQALDAVGLFDERFFVYFEEVDLCRRLAAAGLRRRFVPEARITHVGGVSASASDAASLYLARSMFRYLRKHYPARKAWPGLAALWLGMICRELVQLLVSGAAALVLGPAGREERARRRVRRCASAARWLFRDAWRVLCGC